MSKSIYKYFSPVAQALAAWAGTPYAFLWALMTIILWLSTGTYFRWSDSHSLFINTLTTIITFVMGFVIQYTQNRDSVTIKLMLELLILANPNVSNDYAAIESLDDEQLKELRKKLLAGYEDNKT